jgi:predicted RNA-binding Zn-ribbon protein involved in translation (DUF1610 family)
LNKKLDKALEYVKNRLLTNKAAYAKPKGVDEGWSQKYKSSINCSHPKGFSQKAHCAGKKKHNESIDTVMEMTCPDCGMCETHGDNSKDQLDELKCWSGYHRVAGTKAGFPGSCKKNKTNEEEIDEADMNRRGFLKGMGAAAVAGAAGGISADRFLRKQQNKKIELPDDPTVYYLLGYLWGFSYLYPYNKTLEQWLKELGPYIGEVTLIIQSSGPNKLTQAYNKGFEQASQDVEFQKKSGMSDEKLANYYATNWGSSYNKLLTKLNKTDESVSQGVAEEQHSCPHCGGEMVSEELMNEKKDACYYKVKSRYKVWPSAYASGALVKCRNKGASNWGNGGKKNESSILEGIERADESLHDWFNKEKWVRMDTKGKIKGPCAREPGEGKPKCLPQSKAHSLGKKGRASAAQRKRREDPNPERSGKAINVNTKKK